MAKQTPPSDAQKKRAERLRAEIESLGSGKKPRGEPSSPRELTDDAARDEANKSGSGEDPSEPPGDR